MNEYKLHQVSTKIGDSSTSQTDQKRTPSRRRPRSLGLQATALPGAAARGSRRLRGRGDAAAYGDDGSGAVGEDDRGRWAGEGRFPYKKKVVTVEVIVQGIPGVKMMKFQFFFWGRKWTAIRICNVRYALWNIGPSQGKSTMCETFAPQK